MGKSVTKFAVSVSSLAYRAGHKITALFCTGIIVTVAGGTYSYFSGNDGTATNGERFPSSMSAEEIAAAREGRALPGFSKKGLENFMNLGEINGGMPANYAERANDPANRDTVTPVEVIQPTDVANNLQSIANQRAAFDQQLSLAGMLANTETNTSTSTATATKEQTGVGVGGIGSNTATNTATSVAISGPVGFTFTGSDTGWVGVCQKGVVTLIDATFSAKAATTAAAFSLSTSAGTLYSDAGCTSEVTALTIAAGSSTGTIYFKSDAAGTATITATTSGLGTGTTTISTGTPTASLALGQANTTSNTANQGGAAASGTVSQPGGVLRVGSRLFVADTANHRVLIWNSVPTVSGQAADLVLGQPDFATVTANTGGVTNISLSGPTSVASDGTKLFVADTDNHRVLIWNSLPTTTRAPADHVVGQSAMNLNNANQGGVAAADSLSTPTCVVSSGTRLFVCDRGNNRVLSWPTIPTTDGAAATVAIGQPDLVTATTGSTDAKLDNPTGAFISGTRLYVADFANHRVLAWNTLPTASNTSASIALGQPDTASNTANNGGLGAATLSNPAAVAVDSQGRVLVSDFGNNRVLIFNSEPSASGAEANGTLGQPDLVTNTANNGGVSTTSLSGPWGLSILDSELWVGEFTNHRVLPFTLP